MDLTFLRNPAWFSLTLVALVAGTLAAEDGQAPRNVAALEVPDVNWASFSDEDYGTPFSEVDLDLQATTFSGGIMLAGTNGQVAAAGRLDGFGIWDGFSLSGGSLVDAFWADDHWVGLDTAGKTYRSAEGRYWTAGAVLTGGSAASVDGEGSRVVVNMFPRALRFSGDGGASWDPLVYTPLGSATTAAMGIVTVIGDTVYVPGIVGTDAVIAHAPVGALPAPGTAWPFAVLGTGSPGNVMRFAGGLFMGGGKVGGQPQIYESTDGVAWSALATDLPADGSMITCLMRSSTVGGGFLVAKTQAPYVMVSDNLYTWTAMDDGLGQGPGAIAEDGFGLYATQDANGIFRWDGSQWSVELSGVDAYFLKTADVPNGALRVPGTVTYDPVPGSMPGAGTVVVSAQFTPTDTAHYASVSATNAISVTAVAPDIDVPVISGLTYGDPLPAGALAAQAYTDVGSVMIAGGNYGATAANRRNGIGDWQSFVQPGGGTCDAFWSVDHWVGLDGSGTISTSFDGVAWTAVTTLTGGGAATLDGDGRNVVARLYPRGLRISSDGGATWDPQGYTPFGNLTVQLLKATVIGSRIFVPAENGADCDLAYADIGAIPAPGVAWPSVRFGVGTGGNVYARNGTLLFGGGQVGGQAQLYSSIDGGGSWGTVATDLPVDGSYIYHIMYSQVLHEYLIGRTTAPYVMESTDLAHWTAMDVGLTGIVDAINEQGGDLFCTQRGHGVYQWVGSWIPASAEIEGETLKVSGGISATRTAVPGTYSYNPPAGTVLPAGANDVVVTFTPDDGVDYTSVSATATVTVAPQVPVITWDVPAAFGYGTALSAVQLNATSAVAGTFAYSPPAGTVATVGTVVTAQFTPTDAVDYSSASAAVALTVIPATPVVTWAVPAPMASGTALSATELNASADVPGSFTYAPGAGTVLTAGTHAVTATFLPADAVDYAAVTTAVTITMLPAAPVISSPGVASVVAGVAFTYQISATNDPTSYSATGLPAGVAIDTATGVVTGAFASVGTYVISVQAANSGGTGTATVTVTVTPAPAGTTAAPATATATAGSGGGGGGGGCGLGAGLAGLLVAWLGLRTRRARRGHGIAPG